MKKYCVYTAIVGNYDEIRQPAAVDDDFDYLLFSDDVGEKQVGVWKVMPIGYHNEVKTKVARWVKTHPELLLPEYENSIWMDASVVIRDGSFYDRVKELTEQNELVSTLTHPDWTCTYQEMLHIMYLGWESESTTLDWGHHMRKEGFPRDVGTFETRVLYRMHNEKAVKALDELWWNCIEHYSRRDQYSFRYCLWKEKIECHGFLPEGFDAKDNPLFVVESHSGKSINKRVGDGKKGWLMRYYYKHADEEVKIAHAVYWIYGRNNYQLWWELMGQAFRVRHLFLRLFGKKNVYMWQLKKQ